jgi:uncharacterized protein
MLGKLTAKQIETVLRASTVGRIGASAGGKTYVVPVTYVFDGDAVYGHTTVGQKVRMMRANPDVCFEVDEINDMANWKSVIAYGRYEELGGDVAVAAAKLIAARLGPLTTSQTAGPSGKTRGRTPVSYRIRLVERTGRFERRAVRRRKGGSHG